ncbi:DUF2797 domain-containing protein [Fulvivirga lutea]|uniref:DUF2797 domain-containing protein n=1 Tax=Fulvivirga lutea TaxID=2810512 RepID=A0A974WF16_9BACT|nr:DUF2797 domain-containing protein [Fulvivirga lutea]QSE96499.1 DUF2797 domain-containing protein [Fulvivirga lutea]
MTVNLEDTPFKGNGIPLIDNKKEIFNYFDSLAAKHLIVLPSLIKNERMYKGVLTKMRTEFGSPINYYLNLGDESIHMNDLLGRPLQMNYAGQQCLNCGKDRKIYRMGHCYNCFYELPQTADWVIRPELSKAHLDIEDRDLAYEKEVQLQPHIVYLALSSNIKVGVTRKTQVPTRWIDQGATSALEIVEAPNRYLAGVAEVALKEFVADKTNWRQMLKNEVAEEDLFEFRDKLSQHIPEEVQPYFLSENTDKWLLDFPVHKYPVKIKSLNLAKTPEFRDTLVGIKGQYLIFENETVFNVRGNEGLVLELTT